MNPGVHDFKVQRVSILPCQVQIDPSSTNPRYLPEEYQAGSITKNPDKPTLQFLGEDQKFKALRREAKLAEYSRNKMLARSSSSILGIVPEADCLLNVPVAKSFSFYRKGQPKMIDEEDGTLNLLSYHYPCFLFLPKRMATRVLLDVHKVVHQY
jgi:hypothetical protein